MARSRGDLPESTNPDHVEKTGRFYIASPTGMQDFKVGDSIKRGPASDDACLYASGTIDGAIEMGGFYNAIYEVQGTTCPHFWPSTVVSGIVHPSGGWRQMFVDPSYDELYQPHAFQFDKLVVTAVLTHEIFGDNGRQVIEALRWFRSIYRREGEAIVPISSFRNALTQMWKIYTDRISDPQWRKVTQFYEEMTEDERSLTKWLRRGQLVRYSNRLWLRPWELARIWNDALDAASVKQRVVQCRWLGLGSPGLAALALRDALPASSFRAMYAGLNLIIPLEELDRRIDPVQFWKPSPPFNSSAGSKI